jgi:hypothetical protein
VKDGVVDELIGAVLGERFLVVDRLGAGKSGTIYRGEHVTLRRKVAIKVLHHELSRDDLAIERFRREATSVAEIDNEHIVEIHDFGRTSDGPAVPRDGAARGRDARQRAGARRQAADRSRARHPDDPGGRGADGGATRSATSIATCGRATSTSRIVEARPTSSSCSTSGSRSSSSTDSAAPRRRASA